MKKVKRKRDIINEMANDTTHSKSILEVLMQNKSKSEVYVKLLDTGTIDYAEINAIKQVPHPLFMSFSESYAGHPIQLSSVFGFGSSRSKLKSYAGKDFYDLYDGIDRIPMNFELVQRNKEKMDEDLEAQKKYYYKAISNEWLLIKLLKNGFDPLQTLWREDGNEQNLISIAAHNVMPSLLDSIFSKHKSREVEEFLSSQEAFDLVRRAAANDHLAILEIFDKHHYDFFQLNRKENKESLLFYCESTPILEFFLKQGLDINQTNDQGLTPIDYWPKNFRGEELAAMQKFCENLVNVEDKEEILSKLINQVNQNGLDNFTLIPDWHNEKDKNGVLYMERFIDIALSYRLDHASKKRGDYSGPSFRNFRDVVFKAAKTMNVELLDSERGPMDFGNKFKLFAHLIASTEKGHKLKATLDVLWRRKVDTKPQIFTGVMFDWIIQKTIVSEKKENEDYQSLDSLKFKNERDHFSNNRSGMPQLDSYLDFILEDVRNGDFIATSDEKSIKKYANFCILSNNGQEYKNSQLSYAFHSKVLENTASESQFSEKRKVYLDVLKVFLIKCAKDHCSKGTYSKYNSQSIQNENLNTYWKESMDGEAQFDDNLNLLTFAYKFVEIKAQTGIAIDEDEKKAIQKINNYFAHPALQNLVERNDLSMKLKEQIKTTQHAPKASPTLTNRF